MNDLDFPLPKQQKKLLLDLVRLARKNNVLSIHFSSSLDINNIYHISVYFNDADHISLKLAENPALAFDALEFVKYNEEKHILILMPKVFKWADYENKNLFFKLLAKLPSTVKDIMIIVAFTLSLALTAIQILQGLNSTP